MKLIFFEVMQSHFAYITELNVSFEVFKEHEFENDTMYEFTEYQLINFCKNNNSEKLDMIVNLINESIFKPQTPPITSSEVCLSIHPSRRCNLSCKYCFKDEYYLQKEVISIETVKNAIDYFIHKIGNKYSSIKIDLSGSGEPLLNFQLIKDIVNYCEQKETEIGKTILILLSTNGTLITEEVIDFFQNTSVLLGISLDGDKLQNDQTRKFRSNESSYQKIIEGVNKLNKFSIGASATVTEFNSDVDKIYNEFSKYENIGSYSVRFARGSIEGRNALENIDLYKLEKSYIKVSKEIMKKISTKDYSMFKKIVNGSDFFGEYILKAFSSGTKYITRCDAGITRYAVDFNGDLYACSVLNGDEKYYLGDIENGLNNSRITSFQHSNVELNKVCNQCWLKFYCGGECYVTLDNNYGNPDPNLCEIKKVIMKVAIWFVNEIKTKYVEHIHEINLIRMELLGYPRTNSALWVTNTLFKRKGINMPYKNIRKNMPASSRYTSPTELLYFLNMHQLNYACFKVEEYIELSSSDNLILGLVNKIVSPVYEYIIIKSISNGRVEIETIDCDNKIYPFDYFISNICDVFITKDI